MARARYLHLISLWLIIFLICQAFTLVTFQFFNITPSVDYFWGVTGRIQNIILIVILFFLAILFFKNTVKKYNLAIVLILSGASSNLFERIFYHGVIDYIPFFVYSTKCNFADLVLTLGVVLFATNLFRNEKERGTITQ